jgi:integrase
MYRRWLSATQLTALWNVSEGRQRLVVALEGFNGLRRCERLRLRVGDVELAADAAVIHVLGQVKNGGKWRTIPLSPFAYGELVVACQGQGSTDRLYPFHERTADHDIRRAAEAAGLWTRNFRHGSRRTFGRLVYEPGLGLVELKYGFAHGSVDMTAHYIGLDGKSAREGLALVPDGMRGLLAV